MPRGIHGFRLDALGFHRLPASDTARAQFPHAAANCIAESRRRRAAPLDFLGLGTLCKHSNRQRTAVNSGLRRCSTGFCPLPLVLHSCTPSDPPPNRSSTPLPIHGLLISLAAKRAQRANKTARINFARARSHARERRVMNVPTPSTSVILWGMLESDHVTSLSVLRCFRVFLCACICMSVTTHARSCNRCAHDVAMLERGRF